MARQELTNEVIEAVASDTLRVRSILRAVLDDMSMKDLQDMMDALKSGEFDAELKNILDTGGTA